MMMMNAFVYDIIIPMHMAVPGALVTYAKAKCWINYEAVIVVIG